jgi:hypothetical protein
MDGFPINLKPLAFSANSKLIQIQSIVPVEISLENERHTDWFLRAEIRNYNTEVAYINGALQDCLQCRIYKDFTTIQSLICFIIHDQVPPTFPHSRKGSSLSSLLWGLTKKRNYFQAWLEGGPPICHDISLYDDIRSFLANLCLGSDQASNQGYKFSLKVSRFENAKDISATASHGVFVHGLLACRCKWDAKRRRFCSLTANDESCSNLPVCLLSLDHGISDGVDNRRSLPFYNLRCGGAPTSKEVAVATFSVGIQEECVETMVASHACLSCKHDA